MSRVPLQQAFVGFSVAFAAILLALNCAGQAPPSGGPPDTTPPTIISTYPESGTTEFHDKLIVLEFSEYVDRRSVEESIFISPALRSLEFDWSGREVEVRFDEPLRENITYVVTVGTDVIDVRNRNRMAESFSLAFSTGSRIDSASLRGTVFDQKPHGVAIFAYALNHRRQDTLNPAMVKPDYVTQTGNDGSFKLEHLAWGRYRLFAVRDEFKNFIYDPQVDQVGMTTQDFEANPDHPRVDGIQFQLTMEDTTPPFVLDAQAMNKNQIRVRFSEPIDISRLANDAVSLVDTSSNSQVPIRKIFTTSRTAAYLFTAEMDSLKGYRLKAHAAHDTAGNLINPTANSATFRGNSQPDTLPPHVVSVNVQDSARNISYNVSIDILFSEGVRESPCESGFRLIDSTGRKVDGEFEWWKSAALRFTPNKPLQPLSWYSLRLQLDSARDFAGNHHRDSLFIRAFQTIDPRKLGSIRGRVEDALENARSPISLSAVSVSDKTAVRVIVNRKSAGEFDFENLLEGQYVVSGFRDADLNGKYSFGRSFPFVYAERFTVYPDTIKVRARWPVEGVTLRFRAY